MRMTRLLRVEIINNVAESRVVAGLLITPSEHSCYHLTLICLFL